MSLFGDGLICGPRSKRHQDTSKHWTQTQLFYQRMKGLSNIFATIWSWWYGRNHNHHENCEKERIANAESTFTRNSPFYFQTVTHVSWIPDNLHWGFVIKYTSDHFFADSSRVVIVGKYDKTLHFAEWHRANICVFYSVTTIIRGVFMKNTNVWKQKSFNLSHKQGTWFHFSSSSLHPNFKRVNLPITQHWSQDDEIL